MKKLNARQKLFVAHYLIDRNGAKAARSAGCKPSAAAGYAAENLRKPHIIAALEKGLAKVNEEAELTAVEVLREIRKLAFVDNTAAFNEDGTLKSFGEMSEANRKSIIGIESEEIHAGRGLKRRAIGKAHKIKNADKLRALEMLAKHFKLLTDVHELSGKNGEAISVNLTMPANGSEAKPEKESVAAVPAESKEQHETQAAHKDEGAPDGQA